MISATNRTCNFTTLALRVSLRSVLCLKCSETLCTSGFVDDVISAHAPHGGMCRCGCNELLRLAHANAHAAFYCLCRGLQSPGTPPANHIIERQKHCRPLQTQFLAHFTTTISTGTVCCVVYMRQLNLLLRIQRKQNVPISVSEITDLCSFGTMLTLRYLVSLFCSKRVTSLLQFVYFDNRSLNYGDSLHLCLMYNFQHNHDHIRCLRCGI